MKRHRASTGFYNLVRLMGRPFRYRVMGLEQVPEAGPAIFVSNHLGSVGPVSCILSLPVRFYPWVRAEMTSFRRAPQYLYDDFVHPTWGLNGRMGMAVSFLVSRISVSLLRGLDSISVERTEGESISAFRNSLTFLLEGQKVLVFPEDTQLPADPQTHLHPFQCGFLGLCSMYARATGKTVPLIPMAVHAGRKAIAVGATMPYEDTNHRRRDVRAMADRLYQRVAELYRGLEQAESR